MTYQDLLEQNTNDDLRRRKEYLKTLQLKELVAAVNSPLADCRNVAVAKQILKERNVQGIPE